VSGATTSRSVSKRERPGERAVAERGGGHSVRLTRALRLDCRTWTRPSGSSTPASEG
jgi:hypothetical protein